MGHTVRSFEDSNFSNIGCGPALEPVKGLKVTTLADNLTFHGSLLGQWGLSFLLEITAADDRKRMIIFDTGAVKDALLFNIDQLGIDLSNLEAVVLSHGHRDHTAATVELVRRSRRRVQVIAHPHAFKKRFVVTRDGKRRFFQVPKGEREKDIEQAGAGLVLTKEPFQILPGVATTGEISRLTRFERIVGKRFIVVGRESQRDSILDDQALIVNVRGQGAWVVTGCAHSGIINTLRKTESIAPSSSVHAVVGGFHLASRREDEIKPTVDALRSYKPKLISPCHCTGFRATRMIWEAFEREFVLNFSGRTIMSGERTRPNTL